MIRKIVKGMLAASVLLASCDMLDKGEPDETLTPTNVGVLNGKEITIDFSNYVAIGNSLTSGFADGALYREAQLQSYPLILSEQFRQVGLSQFEQPLMPAGGGANGGEEVTGKMSLGGFFGGVPELSVLPASPGAYDKVENAGGLNNWGVPGIRVADIRIPGYGHSTTFGEANPFFYRMLPESRSVATYTDMVVESDPTFFTAWLGNNDILVYAATGGIDGVDGKPEQYGRGGLTTVTDFRNSYEPLIDQLMADGETFGVISNIPAVENIPVFKVFAWNALKMEEGDVLAVNAAIEALTGKNPGLKAGNNGVLVSDEESEAGFRMMTEDELLVMSAAGKLSGMGEVMERLLSGDQTLTAEEFIASLPSDKEYLSEAELSLIRTRTQELNLVIEDIAAKYEQLLLIDFNETFRQFEAEGIQDGDVLLTSTYLFGGAFSLDGTHLTPRGYAFVANKFIERMMEGFGVVIPTVNLSDYATVQVSDN